MTEAESAEPGEKDIDTQLERERERERQKRERADLATQSTASVALGWGYPAGCQGGYLYSVSTGESGRREEEEEEEENLTTSWAIQSGQSSACCYYCVLHRGRTWSVSCCCVV